MPRPGQAIDAAAPGKARYPALSIPERLLILAIAVIQFLIGHGRVWTQAFDWDRSIVWSYVTIAVLVGLALARRRRFGPVSWLLHTLELAGIKFVLTAGFLLGFLITHPRRAPPAAEVVPPQTPTAEPRVRARPEPTKLAEGSLAEIDGQVTGADRQPVAGALVFVSEGLDGLSFQSPTEPAALRNDGQRFSPPLAVVQVGQPLLVRSADHRLHTLQVMKRDRSWVLNVPLLASGQERRLEFNEAKGIVSVECKVHQAREGQAFLAILSHPFHAFSDAGGRFALRAVPKEAAAVAAFDPRHGETSAPVRLEGGGKVNLILSLPR